MIKQPTVMRVFIALIFSLTLISCPQPEVPDHQITGPETATLNSPVTLASEWIYSGRKSPQFDQVSYEWSLELVPVGSQVILDPNFNSTVTLTPDLPGKYIIAVTIVVNGTLLPKVTHVVRVDAYGFYRFSLSNGVNSWEGLMFGTLIWVEIPPAIDRTSLIPEFSVIRGVPQYQGAELINATTVMDLTSNVVLSYLTMDGQPALGAETTITVQDGPPPPFPPGIDPATYKALDQLEFVPLENPLLRFGIWTTITETEVIATFPWGTDLRSLIPRFSWSALSCEVNGIPADPGVTAYDLTQPVEFKLFAMNGSSRVYNLVINHEMDSNMEWIDGYLQSDGVMRFRPSDLSVEVPEISGYTISRIETPYDLWHAVYSWATANGYNFANSGKEGSQIVASPSFTGEPVTSITWSDAVVWCNAFSEMTGKSPVYYTDDSQTAVWRDSTACHEVNCTLDDSIAAGEGIPVSFRAVDQDADGYRLPTAVEWEYAARLDFPGSYYPAASHSGFPVSLNSCAWYGEGSGGTASAGSDYATGLLVPNYQYLFDMSGNVQEYVWDWNAPADEGIYSNPDTMGPEVGGSHRLMMGGNRFSTSAMMQTGMRTAVIPYDDPAHPFTPDSGTGFRLAAGQTQYRNLNAPLLHYMQFTPSDNPGVESPLNFSPVGNTLTGAVPYGEGANLIANYSFSGSEILIDGNSVESGITALDWLTAAQIEVKPVSGAVSTFYTLSITEEDPTAFFVSVANGLDSNSGNKRFPVATIQEAMNRVGSEARFMSLEFIHVENGSYDLPAPLEIKSGIMLTGGWGDDFIDRRYKTDDERFDATWRTKLDYTGSYPGTYTPPVTYDYTSIIRFDGTTLPVSASTGIEGFILNGFNNTAYAAVIEVIGPASPRIAYNTIKDDSGVNSGLFNSIEVGSNCSGTRIEHNLFNLGDGSAGVRGIWTASPIEINGNRFTQKGSLADTITAIGLDTTAANSIVVNNSFRLLAAANGITGIYVAIPALIANNTFILDEGTTFTRGLFLAYGCDPEILNNVFYSTAATAAATAIYEGYSGCAPIISNNYFYGFNNALLYDYDLAPPNDLKIDTVQLNAHPGAADNIEGTIVFEDKPKKVYQVAVGSMPQLLSGALDLSGDPRYPKNASAQPIDINETVRTGDGSTGWTMGAWETD